MHMEKVYKQWRNGKKYSDSAIDKTTQQAWLLVRKWYIRVASRVAEQRKT